MNTQFDDIRPYYDSEIPAAMQRIARSDTFPMLASFVFPDESVSAVRKRIEGYKNIREFQHDTMYTMNRRILEKSTTAFSCSGIERLDPKGAYLYVSNHRDIVLDSSLLQNFLIDSGFETTHITFGANLMMSPLIIDIGKSNKMFKVDRPSDNVREYYRSSSHLSDYIRYVISDLKQSVWIAQRNGRTKDGNDATDQGLMKMFCMSKKDDKIAALDELHIVPTAISYEWESCDILKTLELYTARFTKYIKRPGEDLTSILTGIVKPKGRVHIELCRPIERDELEVLDSLTTNDYHRRVAAIINARIIEAYRLYPNNYIAYDMRYGTSRYKSRYTDNERKAFAERLQQLEQYDNGNIDQLTDIFLGIYATPVENKLKLLGR